MKPKPQKKVKIQAWAVYHSYEGCRTHLYDIAAAHENLLPLAIFLDEKQAKIAKTKGNPILRIRRKTKVIPVEITYKI